MTETSRIASDNLDTMDAAQLRELVRQKQGALNETLRRNQELDKDARRWESAVRERNNTIEVLERKVKFLQTDLNGVVREREDARRLAGLLHEKIEKLAFGEGGRKTSDIKKVAQMYHHAMTQVSKITVWPELSDAAFFEKIFDACEERVFGKKGPKKATDPTEFVQRSLRKKTSKKEVTSDTSG